LPVITSSFHGRDIFSPGAAHLAMGVPLEFVGTQHDAVMSFSLIPYRRIAATLMTSW